MVEKPKALHVLGLEFSDGDIFGAKISQKRGLPCLEQLFSITVPDVSGSEGSSVDVKPLYINPARETLQDVAKCYLVAEALPTSDTLVRGLDVSLKKINDIDAVLAFQAEPLLPYPVEGAILDRIVVSQNPNGTSLTLLAARSDRVLASIEAWRRFHIEPEVVTCTPAALSSFSKLVAPQKTVLTVVHLSLTQTVCVLVRNGVLIASQACSKNLGMLENAFLEDCKIESLTERRAAFAQIRWEELSVETFPCLKAALDVLLLDLTRTLFSLEKQNQGEDVSDILITGSCGEYYDLVFYIGDALKKQVITPEVPATFKAPLPQVLKFAVPIGTALGCLVQSKGVVNFRQGALAYPDPWKRLKKPLFSYLSLCLCVSTALYFLGEAYLGYQKDELLSEYTQLLKVAQKPHTLFEKEIDETSATFALPLKEMSTTQIAQRVALLDKELSSTPDIFPLLPNILNVSDVLAWLNTQSTVVQKDPKTGLMIPLIQIDNFSYTMVKRPEITKKNERYQVKVELEFTTQTPKEAREFHDALIAPNALVDPKEDVKWNTNRGKYRASFYLKDKTVYPTIR